MCWKYRKNSYYSLPFLEVLILLFDCYRANNMIGHCKINRKETGFGFAEPYYIHETLQDLVLHYEQTSLNEHNNMLDVTLKFPVNWKPPPGANAYAVMH